MGQLIKFGTDGWRAIIAKDFTYESLARVTEGTGKWILSQNKIQNSPDKSELLQKPSVVLGYDCRFNGKGFAHAAANQLAQMGIKVFLSPKFASTPMVSLATVQRQTTAGIIITASHNPPEYSGFKVKGSFGGPVFPGMVSEIESQIPEAAPVYADKFDSLLTSGMIEYYDSEALYINHLRQNFDISAIEKSNMILGYDAMYGAGQNVMRRIFPNIHELHCQYNPSFAGQAPEPIERNLAEFQNYILSHNVQWGLATDGDADRIGLFDENGNFVDSHHIILLLIWYLTQYKKLNGKVICTFSCSSKIGILCHKLGLPLQITKIGFKYIGEIMVKDDVLVGGEESGGIAVKGHLPERDGIYIGMLLLEFMAQSGKKLTELIQEIYNQVGSFSVQRDDVMVNSETKKRVLDICKAKDIEQIVNRKVKQIEDLDGYKFYFEDGSWVMLRPSGTEPLLRIYAEGSTSAIAFEIIKDTRIKFGL